MKPQNIQLRNKLLVRVLTPMAIVMAISGVIGYYQARNFVNASYDRSMLEEARGLAEQVQVTGSDVLLDMPAVADEIIRADSTDRIYYQIRILGGEVVAGDTRAAQAAGIVAARRLLQYLRPRRGGAQWSRFRWCRPCTPTIVVQYAETLKKRKVLANEIVFAVIAPQLALMILAWLAIQRGVMVGLAPIERLANTIEQRSPDDLAPLPVSEVPQELMPLLAAFNSMLGRLQGAAQAQKRFVADAAHQLRTPLAALRIQLERALREPDPEVRENLLQQLVAAIERTARLSSQLLSARARRAGRGNRPGRRAFRPVRTGVQDRQQLDHARPCSRMRISDWRRRSILSMCMASR